MSARSEYYDAAVTPSPDAAGDTRTTTASRPTQRPRLRRQNAITGGEFQAPKAKAMARPSHRPRHPTAH